MYQSIYNMHTRKIIRYISIVIIFSALTACTSLPILNDAVSTPGTIDIGPVNGVTIDYSDEVQAKFDTLDSFDIIDFKETVINALDAKDLFSASSDRTLEIRVKSVSAGPSTSSAFSLFNSETAHIKGTLIIKDKSNQIAGQHDISAEYAQRKFSGKQEKVRPVWLYTRFANQTTQTLTGKANEKQALANNATNNNQVVSDAKEASSSGTKKTSFSDTTKTSSSDMKKTSSSDMKKASSSDRKEDSSVAFLESVRIFLILASLVVGYSAAF
jgi:hypothetical protein